MAIHPKLKKAHAELRAFALKYPEAWEDFPWEHCVYKVKTKIFLSLFQHDTEDWLSFSVKLPVSHEVAVALSFAEPAGYGLGKSGWVTARFGADDDIPLHMLMEWIDESYRAIAPKKVVALLETTDEQAAVAVRPKRPKARKK